MGLRDGPAAVEIFGWYLFPRTSSATVTDPRRVDLPFAAYPVPVGLGIDNSVWINADRATIVNLCVWALAVAVVIYRP